MEEQVKRHIKRGGGWFKKFAGEFRTFALRGNMIDMAVGILVGGALSKVVTSIVNDLMMPIITVFTGKLGHAEWVVPLGPEESAPKLLVGSFVSNIIDFVILAFCVFLIVRLINKLTGAFVPAKKPAPVRNCPFCMQTVDEKATRCPHCTSDIGKTGQL